MDVGQVKGTKEKVKKGNKGKGKEKGKGKKDNGEAKGPARTDDSYFAGECGYCGKWRHKKAQCRKQKKDQGSKPPPATIQAVASSIVSARPRLILDICCECIEWTKRKNPGRQWCR